MNYRRYAKYRDNLFLLNQRFVCVTRRTALAARLHMPSALQATARCKCVIVWRTACAQRIARHTDYGDPTGPLTC